MQIALYSLALQGLRKRNKGNKLSCDGLSHFQLLSHHAVKDVWTGGIIRFLITVSLRSKRSMDHPNVFFAFVNVLYREHKCQSTSDGYKSHLCFLIITNRKTNKGWFGSLLFSQLNDTKRESKGRHIQKRGRFAVVFSVLDVANEKWKQV